MFIERFEDRGLSQYSYAVGCEGAGQMAVVDPRRDADVYLDYAAQRDLRIAHVLETHIHADFASGARELAERAGAELWLSAYDAGELYEVAFPHTEMFDGDAIEFGAVRIQALHTPGHTPEHLSFLVYDHARSPTVPMTMLSGDFVFVGSLGRPDLLGEEAKVGLARRLYSSVRSVLHALPDGLEIAPGHGAGSMCGAGMSGRAVSTLGFERIANPYLNPALSEDEFVQTILANVPPFPDYYRRMKVLNSAGPPLLHGLPGLEGIPHDRFRRLADDGHVVIDLRDQLSFGAGHIPGSFGIGAGTSVSTWASWVVPYGRPLLLVGPGTEGIRDAIAALVRVGLDDVRGYLVGGIETWVRAGYPLTQTPQVSAVALAERLERGDPVRILDVRDPAEWRQGRVRGATLIRCGELPKCLDQIPAGQGPIAIVCGGGYRSTVAASVLERAGLANVINVTGGMNAWKQAGLPLVAD